MRGRHLIADVINIENYSLLNTVDGVKPLMEKKIKNMSLNVVGHLHHQFQPIGATCLYLLSESHMTIHTYPEYQSCYIDLFCCSPDFDSLRAIQLIKRAFQTEHVRYQVVTR